MDISVITINYREAQRTLKALRSLMKSKRVAFEVIIIDNSCDKKEADTISSVSGKNIRTFIMKENAGVARGYNFGIRRAKGKYIFILNNDAEIGDDLGLYRMKKYLDTHRDVAVIQPKIKNIANKQTFDYAGASGGFIDTLGYPFCRGRLFQCLENDTGQYDDISDISWASTCAFFARKNILTQVGLFDPIYFAYAEEVDTSIKIWNSGYKIRIFPDTVVYHVGEASWKKRKAKKTFLIHRNHLILYLKCMPTKDALYHAPSRILHEFASIWYYVLTLRPLLVVPILHSYVAVLQMMPQIMKRRKLFFRKYRANSMPVFTKSIAVSHYLLRKKYFSELNGKYLHR